MPKILVTGSSGLIGSEVVAYFAERGWQVVGVDNNLRADFFGPQGDTRWNQRRLIEKFDNFVHVEIDIRQTEEIIFHLLRQLHTAAPSENVVLVGGCAMNSVANGKVTRETPFRHVYVPVGAADNGTAFGAAFHVWHRVLGRPRSCELEHAFWGCGVEEAECWQAVERAGVRCQVSGVGEERGARGEERGARSDGRGVRETRGQGDKETGRQGEAEGRPHPGPLPEGELRAQLPLLTPVPLRARTLD